MKVKFNSINKIDFWKKIEQIREIFCIFFWVVRKCFFLKDDLFSWKGCIFVGLFIHFLRAHGYCGCLKVNSLFIALGQACFSHFSAQINNIWSLVALGYNLELHFFCKKLWVGCNTLYTFFFSFSFSICISVTVWWVNCSYRFSFLLPPIDRKKWNDAFPFKTQMHAFGLHLLYHNSYLGWGFLGLFGQILSWAWRVLSHPSSSWLTMIVSSTTMCLGLMFHFIS